MNSSSETRYEVFLIFNGEDTGRSFVSHLCAALRHQKIRVAEDHGVRKRQADLTSEAIKAAMEGSRVSVVVLSEKYGGSEACLENLVEVLECRGKNNHLLIPVFYGVSRSDVEHQTGAFGAAFKKRKKSRLVHRIPTWRAALEETAGLPGHESNDKRSDSELVEEIVKDVHEKLYAKVENRLVGINSRLLQIEDMLCEQPWGIRSIGIWGMGGIGKTTIAQAVFDRMSSDYDASYFIQDFDKKFREKGLNPLREDYLTKILDAQVDIRSINENQSLIKEKIRNKRIFLVLDDVRNSMDAESLVGGFDWFGPGSIIVITSRDKNVLIRCQVNQIYEAEGLNKQEAMQLFSQCAFGKDEPENDFQEPSTKVIEYAKGNPLALKVFGTLLKGKRSTRKKTSFQELKQRSMSPIMDVLKSSYDSLCFNEKNIFLDLACFFKGEDIDHVIQLLEGCGFFPHFGINILVKMSFITISEQRVEMHDLMQTMGREIVNRESEKPERRSRLWDPSSIKDVLRRTIGTEDIEGIFLDTSKLKCEVNPMAFESMYNLRLLKIYSSSPENNIGLCLRSGLKSLPYELRLFHWENYPLKSLPQDFDPGNLVELNMPYSQLEKLWGGTTKNLAMLKIIRLCHSQQLVEIDEVPKAHNLEHIDLQGCTSLQSFPAAGRLERLKVLYLSGCSKIKSFPEVPQNIKELYLAGTGISEIPTSIELLSRLVKLDLGNCRRLENFPTKIYKLKSLELLNLSGCLRLESFPEISDIMENLRYLYLSETSIKELPYSISNLNALEELHLKNCRNLLNLPESVYKLKSLKVEFNGCVESSSSMNGGQARGDLLLIPYASLLFLASTPYSLLDGHLQNTHKLEIPKAFHELIALCFLDLKENDFKELPPSINELLKPQNLIQWGQVGSLPDFQERNKRISRCTESTSYSHIFTNSSKVDQGLLKEAFTKVLIRMWYLEKQCPLGTCVPPSLVVGLPASVQPDWFALVSPGYSACLRLPHSQQKNNPAGFTFFIVVAFQEDYYNPSGFSIRCICKYKTSSDRFNTFENIFWCWSQNEIEQKIQQDQMFIFYDCSVHHRLAKGHDEGQITFEFYPVDGYNKLLTGCGVTYCAVYMLTAQNENDKVILTTQRSGSCSDLREDVEMEIFGRDGNEERRARRKRRRSGQDF